MTEKEAYESLADFIKDYIYEKQWDHLNLMQIQAIEKIRKKHCNLLLSAGTAMGKTEAAFMPTITELYKHPVPSVGIIYISPLKALINDQFVRIEEMLIGTQIKLTKWHSDAISSQKEKLLFHPNGIIQITPESLEAMLCRYPQNINILFSNTKYIIIDEIHYFMSSERGLQLLAVLERIQRITKNIPIRLGLSATIKDTKKALEFLNSGSMRSGEVLENCEKSHHYQVSVSATKTKGDINDSFIKKLYQEAFGKRALLFTNSRRECEIEIAALKKIAYERGDQDVYYVHHGSISKSIREETEHIMKLEHGPVLTGTTMTLELGVDIGDLDKVIQAAQPLSITSMVQRVGRSGRKTGNSVIAFQLLYQIPDSSRLETIDLSLIRTIAMIELYFREQYMEEIKQCNYPYHILIHEVLSVICQHGCIYPKQLAAQVLELTIFHKISQDDLRTILRILMNKNVLMLYEDGAIGLGDEGERICNQIDFYAVFDTGETYAVKYQENEIGLVEKAYKPGDCFFLAGSAWRVIGCDLNHKRIDVEKSDTNADIYFAGNGTIRTDHVIMSKMHEILASDQYYQYLDQDGMSVLKDIREIARKFHLYDLLVYEENSNNILLFPKVGTDTIHTLYYIFLCAGIQCQRIFLHNLLYGIRVYAMDEKKFFRKLREILSRGSRINKELLLSQEKMNVKYESLLNEDLIYKQLIEDVLDLHGAKQFIRSVLDAQIS